MWLRMFGGEFGQLASIGPADVISEIETARWERGRSLLRPLEESSTRLSMKISLVGGGGWTELFSSKEQVEVFLEVMESHLFDQHIVSLADLRKEEKALGLAKASQKE